MFSGQPTRSPIKKNIDPKNTHCNKVYMGLIIKGTTIFRVMQVVYS